MITQIKSQTRIVIAEFVTKLRADERLTQNVVIEVMNQIFGDSASGKWHWKQATDLIEAAVVKMLLEDDFKSLEDVGNLQSLIPHHQVRSQEQIQLQQFSTPLALAWIIARLANGGKNDIILEPSAGTGILAAAYVNGLSGEKPRRIILNEISPSRKTLLRELFDMEHPIYSANAEYINDTLPQGEQPNLILMNPSFSSSLGNDKRDKECCMKHIRSALLRLIDYGRLVAIVPHWLNPKKQAKYFASLPAQLKLSLFVHGSHYRYYGTTMDTRILVFDKVQPTEMPKSIDYAFSTSARDLWLLAASSCPSKIVVDYQGKPISNPYKEVNPNDRLIEKITDNSTQTFFTGLPLFQLQPVAQLEATFQQISIIRNLAPPIKVIEYCTQFDNLVQLKYQPAIKAKSPMTDGIYAVYQGAITIAGATPHPSPVCESIAMSAIDPPHPTIQIKLPSAIIDKKQASDCQLETLIYACQAHSKLLDTPWYIAENGQIAVATPDNLAGKYHRQGYFVGANTGMGKSRIIALLILANWCEGRKKAVWVSKNESLLPDCQRDWMAIGGNSAQLVPLSKFSQDEPIRLSEGILFVTYGTLRVATCNSNHSGLQSSRY